LSIDRVYLDIEEVDIGSVSDQLVRDIYENNNILYVLTDKNIFSSEDGIEWEEINRDGLPNQLHSLGSVTNNLLIGASDGIYVKAAGSDETDWEKVKSSTHPVTVMESSNVLFTVIDRKIHITANGYSFVDSGLGEDLDITEITRYGFTNTYVATNQGLYSDNGTFNSGTPSLQDIDISILHEEDEFITVNDIATNNTNRTAIAMSNGNYGIIQDNRINAKENTALDSIHKITVVNSDIWLFGYDSFKVPYLDHPIRLSVGVPV
jgi:hypothetical protein